MALIRRLLCAAGVALALYAIACLIFSPPTVAHTLVTLTAIDQWHPNWPDESVVNDVANRLFRSVILFGPIGLLYYFLMRRFFPSRTASSAAIIGADKTLASSGRMQKPYIPTRKQFITDLAETLRAAGLTPEKAQKTADAAALAADEDDASDWYGHAREHALTLGGITGPNTRVLSREPHLDKTARFLREYGYQALRMRRVGASTAPAPGSLDFDGLLVFHRTPAYDAESALIELLTTAHQAHMASMNDNGYRDTGEGVERHGAGLRHVATKLSLRGFVPPELDAEVGRDGTATAEELERWAIAQVVAICSPMTRMPLPTVERTADGAR